MNVNFTTRRLSPSDQIQSRVMIAIIVILTLILLNAVITSQCPDRDQSDGSSHCNTDINNTECCWILYVPEIPN